MHRGILKVSIGAVATAGFAAAFVAAGAGAFSPATAAGSSPLGLGPTPEIGPPVAPSHFRGDVRRIPRGAVVRREERPEPRSPNEAPGLAAADPALQAGSAFAPSPSPSSSFPGLDFANWGAGWPPDTNGDVGPTYYIQTVNTSIGIFDKSTGSRVAAFAFDSFFSQSPTGTPCDNNNQGDPIVVYDPIGDRWIIADFAWSNYTSGAMYECIAVSAGGDPVAGGWNLYPVQVESGGKLPDYPKLGIWPDGIYMSASVFSTRGSGSFQNVQVWAFNRVAMEAGTVTTPVSFSLPKTVGGVTVFSLLPSNARVVTGLPPSGAPNYFASIWGSYAIRVWKFHVDWADPANSTFTGPTNVPIATFNAGPSSVPEKGGNNIDTLSYRLMMQNQYTNLNGTESLWLTHTVGSGGSPNLAQVRWYQLPVTGGTIAGSPAQQSTWSPDSKNRFMPSLAVDKDGDMALGYSVSDASIYPAIRYAGRLASDSANTLGQGETSLIEGTGFQCCKFSNGSTNTRWGDYSAMTIDPDGCTFWYTNEYYDTQPTTLLGDDWKTRIGSFRFSSCGSTAPSYRTTVLADNPVSYWRLGESSGTTAADEQGTNPGTYVGSPTLGQPGLLTGDPNTAVAFNGSSAKVEVASVQTPRTIEAWVKTTSTAEQPIWSNRNNRAGTGNGIYFGTIEGRLFIYENSWTPPQLPHDIFNSGGPFVADGLPHQVVWTMEEASGTGRLYVDGQLKVAETQTGDFTQHPSQPARIGWDYDNISEYFNGTLDEISVYNTVLSPARVLAHYNAGAHT